MSKKFDVIIVTSDEPYGQMWHTQLIYADYLTKDYPVFYINPPDKWSIGDIFKRNLKTSKVTGSLTIVEYPNVYPSRWNSLNDKFLAKLILSELTKLKAKNVLCWHFDSFRSSFKDYLFNEKINLKRIYHVIDPFYHNPLNNWLAEQATILAVTSERNKKHYPTHAGKTIVVRQAIDLTLHKQYLEKESTHILPEKFAVLLGTISDDVDLDLLYKLISGSKTELVIIGKVFELHRQDLHWKKLISLPNVYYKGLLTPQDFYPVLKKAFAGLIIYTSQKQKQVSSPLKVLNYLMASLPVITNLNCEIPELLEKGIYEYTPEAELKKSLETAWQSKLKIDKEAVNKYLNEVSLPNVINKILAGF